MAAKSGGGADMISKILQEEGVDRILSGRWLDQKPTPEDFGLEGINLNELYRSRKQFESHNEREADELVRQIQTVKMEDQKVRSRGSVKALTWMTALVGIPGIIYAFLSPRPQAWLLFLLAGLTTVFLVLVIGMKIRDGRRYLKKLHMLQDRLKAVEERKFFDEKSYDNLIAYAEAQCDHERWEKRAKAGYWKALTQEGLHEETAGLFLMYGYEVDTEAGGHLLLSDSETRTLVGVKAGEEAGLQEMRALAREMEQRGKIKGVLISTEGFTEEAERYGIRHRIETFLPDDLTAIAKEVEAMYREAR